MLLSHSDTFSPVSTKHRIFLKAPYAQVFTARPAKTQSRSETANTAQVRQKSGHAAAARKFAPIAIEPHPVAHLVVDRDGVLMQINEHARTLFGLALHHVGHPIHKLDIARRPVELEELIKGVYAKGRSVRLKNVPHTGLSGEAQSFDVELVPLLAKQGKQIGVSVFFHEVTKIAALKREHMRAVEELETVNEELQATNEVLQSTNEELETTNEELQSANEELETMNEELQSSNEELRSLNELLQTHTQSANTSNAFLKAVLGGLNAGVAVVDRDFTVRAWNQKAEDLWGLRSEETCGQHLLSLDIGLPVERLKDTVRASLAGESTGQGIVLDAVNRRGKSIRCRVTCTPLMNDGKEVQGAIAFMEELSA